MSSPSTFPLGPLPWVTRLSPPEEQEFRTWVTANKIPFNPDDSFSDYDMRGFWKAMKSGNVDAVRSSINGHFPDTWKTPFHRSFSNESIYASYGKNVPHWVENTLVSPQGKVVFREK